MSTRTGVVILSVSLAILVVWYLVLWYVSRDDEDDWR